MAHVDVDDNQNEEEHPPINTNEDSSIITEIPVQFLVDIVKRIKELSGEVAILRLMVDPTKKFPHGYSEP